MMEPISPPQFDDEHFMSADEKEAVFRSWLRFLKRGCSWHDFTIALYEHLILHCSFIAHYNRLGFFEYYFSSPGEQAFRFLDQFDPAKPGVSAEIGLTFWLNGPTASDLNRAMRDIAAPFITKLRERFRLEIRQRDLAQAAALAKAHGFTLIEENGGAVAEPEHFPVDLPNSESPTVQQALFPD